MNEREKKRKFLDILDTRETRKIVSKVKQQNDGEKTTHKPTFPKKVSKSA